MANSRRTWSSERYSFLDRKLQSFSIREKGGVDSSRSTFVSWKESRLVLSSVPE